LLIADRLAHAWALSSSGHFGARTAGMLMTFTALILSAALDSNFRPGTTFPLAKPRGTL
jgi:uncharacterized membrane protein YecN with MAPEG domain